jgi:integrase
MATVNIYLDNRRTFEGKGIIKLLVTHNRVPRLVSTNLKCTQEDYDKLKGSGAKLDSRIKNQDIINIHNLLYSPKNEKKLIYSDGFVLRAENIINELGKNFDFDRFKQLFDNYGKESKSVAEDAISYIRKKSLALKENGQFSHGEDFSSLAKSLSRFVEYLKDEYPNKLNGYKKGKDYTLLFDHITVQFMEDWSEWMQIEGKAPKKVGNTPTGASITTVSIYAKALRTTFNEVIANGLISQDKYPFGLRGFSIPSGKNIKKALSNKDLELIKNYEPEKDSLEERSRDLWLFSYYGQGMNFADMLTLRCQDVKESGIYFVRAKTMGKASEDKVIHVRLNDFMKTVIGKYGNKFGKKNDYLFPYVNPKDSHEQQRKDVHQIVALTNKYMNRIGQKLGIESKLNTYEARHTFATKLLRSNAPLALISSSLGHSSISTTENYLGSFEKETEDYFLDML